MTLAKTLWDLNRDLAYACLDHPFVRGIYTGELPRERFAYYVGQDAFYLESFARAYSIAAAKAPDWQGFRTLHGLVEGVLEELHLHQSYAASWNVDMQAVDPGPTTRRYTDFLLATAWSHDTGLTAVAMLPCMRLYAFLGQELAKRGMPDHDYTNWIRTYSDTGLNDLVQQLEHLANAYAQDTQLTRSTYHYAMLCERDFFQAAWDFA